MEIDNVLKKIDFTDEQEINEKINEMLQEIRFGDGDTIEKIFTFERLLIVAQSQLIPFIEKIANFKSLKRFSDLKNSFEYILKCWRENRMRPYPELEYYMDLSYDTAIIVGDDYEVLLEEDESIKEKYSEQEIRKIQDEWYLEIEQKDFKTKIIVESVYDILETQYYFLNYFNYMHKCLRFWVPFGFFFLFVCLVFFCFVF